MLALTRVPSAIPLSGASHVPIGFDGENFIPLAVMPLSDSILPLKDAGAHRSRCMDKVKRERLLLPGIWTSSDQALGWYHEKARRWQQGYAACG
jgi:hypothetical protein